jgi:hypothetical protein
MYLSRRNLFIYGCSPPVVVPDLFKNLPGLASHGHVPTPIRVAAKRNILERIPEVLAQRFIAKKTPILILAKQVVLPTGICHFILVATISKQRGANDDKHNQE